MPYWHHYVTGGLMEIKPCPFCGEESQVCHQTSSFIVMCTHCETSTVDYDCPVAAADAWNQRYEQNPSEADRWLNEATEQRDRAELAEMQRDEVALALEAAKRMLVYAGKAE